MKKRLPMEKLILSAVLSLLIPLSIYSQTSESWNESGDKTTTSNKIGIKTNTPKGALHVSGDMVLGRDQNNSKFIFHPRTNRKGNFLHITNDNTSGNWDWKNGLILYRGGNISIGTYEHDAKLTVNGKVKILGGSPGLGKVLTSDAGGMASWETPISSVLPTNPPDGTIAFYNTGNWEVLTPGAEGQVLTIRGGLPVWADSIDPTDSTTTTVSHPLQIGDFHAGGIIFYLAGPNEDLNGDGNPDEGLVAALADAPRKPYNDWGSKNIWTWDDAKSYCENYDDGTYDDWFLPNLYQLSLIYSNLYEKEQGGFIKGGDYWSSSEAGPNDAEFLDFSNNEFRIYPKEPAGCFVRAVRAF